MDLDTRKHKAIVRESYAARVKTYTEGKRAGENVQPMIDAASPQKTDRVLDVACGAGLVALAFAPHVAQVTGVDLTEEMVDLARRHAAERKLTNVDFKVGDAEALPAGPGAYDIVTCRSAFHSFKNAEKALHEMARVLAAKGRIVVYDLVTSEDASKAARHNEIMALRDPSHVAVLSPEQWTEFVRRCGLHVADKTIVMMKREFEDWMDIVAADAERRVAVKAALASTEEHDEAGLGVRVRSGRMTFSQTAGIWLLTK
jgi:ubiquinone/menaquinone biosynthesis C-methylase UbiE